MSDTMAVSTMIEPPLNNVKHSYTTGLQATCETFWQGLTLEEKNASTNPEYSRSFNDEHAWDPAGPVQDAWNKTIYPNILKPLFLGNGEAIFKRRRKQPHYIITCWMVGKERQSAHPSVVFICDDAKFSEKALKLVRKSEVHGRWGFRVYGYRTKIASNRGGSDRKAEGNGGICGTLFNVGDESNVYDYSATIGGAVVINGVYFGVTVSHAFLDAHYGDQTDGSDDDSDESSSDTDLDILEHEESIKLRATQAFATDSTGSNQTRLLGDIPETMPGFENGRTQPAFWSIEADWALIRLIDSASPKNSVSTEDGEIVLSKYSVWAEGRVWAAVGPLKPVPAIASQTLCGLSTPYSGFRDVFALRMKPEPGDCGAWVVNADEKSVVGSIVAGCSAQDITYVAPATEIFEGIKSRFTSMQFPPVHQLSPQKVGSFELWRLLGGDLIKVTRPARSMTEEERRLRIARWATRRWMRKVGLRPSTMKGVDKSLLPEQQGLYLDPGVVTSKPN
ncbi:hypothetical protein P170DRAFT_175299 [Aspergillus steynii IBT 23096]|uniref:Uncharacterized protein n=1 Tax=Aspergillus steynii IBT 23096 TaxID=1392250 RepID=A0A2I2G8D9_9EURO|nr:uncharacterized protein P170DRAFT_175299 [Aspergillus steynii IBT 23096]PLB49135.1 hypothetical protein P170DRAFT_175299 [Aspergillus steynii IBT 23096]